MTVIQLWLWLLLAAWLLWCAGNLLLMAIAHPDAPHATGFGIYVPIHYAYELEPEEFLAIYTHECGHVHHRHAWKNFALVCIFCKVSTNSRAQQELEADDYAAAQGMALPLASALRKLSIHRIDQQRAQRLEARCRLGMAKEQA